MADPIKWGVKYKCHGCACKFYDLNKPRAVCPKCGADQAEKARAVEEVLEEEELEGADDDKLEAEDKEGDAAVSDPDDSLTPPEEVLGYDETDEEE